MQATNDTEPLVRGSWPLTITDGDGRILWHVAGTNPPEYAADDKLEALWVEGQTRLYRTARKIIQLELWEKAA